MIQETTAELRRLKKLAEDALTQVQDADFFAALDAEFTGSTAVAYAGDHVVSKGETLSHIAVRYGTTTGALARARGLASPPLAIATAAHGRGPPTARSRGPSRPHR